MPSSRLPGFYELPLRERAKLAGQVGELGDKETADLLNFNTLPGDLTDTFIENAIGTYSLPLGVATNFRINGRDVLVPMAVEETSVLAGASHGAKLARAGGGFRTWSTEPIMIGQIQLLGMAGQPFEKVLSENKAELLRYANRGQDRLVARGGGARDMTWRFIEALDSLVIHLHIHTCDAMGANIVNTMCEKVAVFMPDLFPRSTIGLRILSNLTTERMAGAECVVPSSALDRGDAFTGAEVVERIVGAGAFAEHDVFRAATHNKGVMNGIDPVLIATGNDWRAVEAGAHAYAARKGHYQPMTRWWKTDAGNLAGAIELPMAVGTIGGVTKLHPTAQSALKMLGRPSARELAEILCAVGLAQNLAALRALATEGIQPGHMGLHRANIDLLARKRLQH